jgi:hypothetical protein
MTYVEQNCTFTHNGRDFTAGGAVVTSDFARGYLTFDTPELIGTTGAVTDWHGTRLGTARIVGRWRTPRSFMASHMLQVECRIDGVLYTGRGCGNGMVWSGKRCAKQ